MIRSIPNINTARLTLRGMRPEDFERFAAIWAMPGTVRYLGGAPRSRGAAWEMFLRNAGHWQMAGFGQWAVVDQRRRQLIGQAGFAFGARGLGEAFDPFPETSVILAPEAQGRGLGREAAQAAHDWFDRVIPGPLVAAAAPANGPACRLAQRLGYRVLGEAAIAGGPVRLMRRDGPPGRG